MKPYFRNETSGDFAPFKRMDIVGNNYDLRLMKDGVIANIINSQIVSIEGTIDQSLADSAINELARFGFKVPE